MCSHYLPLTLPDGSGLHTVFLAVAKEVERTDEFRTAIAAARRACKDMQFKHLQDKKSKLTGDELFYVKFLYTWTLEELFKRRHGRVRVCQPIPPLGIAYVGTPLIPPQQIDQLPDRIFVQQKWSKQQTVLELFTSKNGSSNVYSRVVEAVPKFRIVTAGKNHRCVVKEITWNGIMFPLTRSEGRRGTARARGRQQQQAEDSGGSSSDDDVSSSSSDDAEGSRDDNDDDKSSSDDDEQEQGENDSSSTSSSSSQHETRIVRHGGRYPLRRTTTRTDAAEGSNGNGGDGSSSPAESDSESDDSRDEEQEGDEPEDASRTADGAEAVPPPPGAADARGTVPRQIVLAQQHQPPPDRNVQEQLQAMQQQFQAMQQQMGQVQDQIQLLVAATQQRRQSQQGQQQPAMQPPEGNGMPAVRRRPRPHEVTPDGNNQQQKRRRLDGDFDDDGAAAVSTMTEPSYEEVRDWVVTVVSDDKARVYLENLTDADTDTYEGNKKLVTRSEGNRYEIVLDYHRCGELDHLLIRHKPCMKWLQDIGKSAEWVRHRLLQELDGHVLHDPNLDSVQRKEMTTPDNRKAKYGRLNAKLVVSYGTAPAQDWRMDALYPHFQGILLLTIGHPTDVAPVQNVLRMGPNDLQVEDVVHMLCYPNVVSRKAKDDMIQALCGVPDAVDLVTQYGWVLASSEDIQKAHDDAMKNVPGQGSKVRGYMGFPGSMIHREPAHDETGVSLWGTYGPPSSHKTHQPKFQQKQHTATSVLEQLSDSIVPRMRTAEAKKAFQEAGQRLGQGPKKADGGGKKNFFQYWFGY